MGNFCPTCGSSGNYMCKWCSSPYYGGVEIKYCQQHSIKCSFCNGIVCKEHSAKCEECGKRGCRSPENKEDSCVLVDDICKSCRGYDY